MTSETKKVPGALKSAQAKVNQKSKSVQTKMGKKNTIRKPLNIGKGAETPKAIARSEMDDKESQKGKVSAKDLFKAIQFAEIKQRIKSPTCLSTNSHQSTLIKPWQIC